MLLTLSQSSRLQLWRPTEKIRHHCRQPGYQSPLPLHCLLTCADGGIACDHLGPCHGGVPEGTFCLQLWFASNQMLDEITRCYVGFSKYSFFYAFSLIFFLSFGGPPYSKTQETFAISNAAIKSSLDHSNRRSFTIDRGWKGFKDGHRHPIVHQKQDFGAWSFWGVPWHPSPKPNNAKQHWWAARSYTKISITSMLAAIQMPFP